MRIVFMFLSIMILAGMSLSIGTAQEEKKTAQVKEKKPQAAAVEQVKEKKPTATKEDKEKSEIPKVTADKPIDFWMAKKLDYSKSILEALTKGEFKKVASDAEQMRLLGKIEGFVRRKNESYRSQMHSFDMANQELVRMAKRENAEGATLAFNQLTSSCVACQLLLRENVE